MSSQNSRLGYLMKRLEVSGKELSNQLSIDMTTISKWKNNQRKLTYKSENTRKIADYLISNEPKNKTGEIARLLTAYLPGLNTESEQQLADALCLWLSDNDEPIFERLRTPSAADASQETYMAQVKMFTGRNGVSEAITEFLTYALQVPPDREILMTDFRDMDFEQDDAENVQRFMKLFIDAARCGHTVKIIDCATDVYRSYKAVLRWLPMYLSENVEIWRYPEYFDRETRTTTFVMPGEIALNTAAVLSEPVVKHGMLYADKPTVDFFTQSARSALNKSKRMIETVDTSDTLHMLNILDENLKSRQLTYMLNPMPTFRNMSENLLRRVLQANDVDEETTRICMETSARTRAIRNRCQYRQIYDLDKIEACVKEGAMPDYDLSAICKKDIRIGREHLRDYLQYLKGIGNTEDYSITLAPFSQLELLSADVSFIVQDDSLVVAWDAKRFSRRMHCRELVLVSGFYKYMDSMWKVIPPLCKSEEWRDKQFNRMIDML